MTEFGGVPDVAKMRRYGVYWAYFASWGGDLGPHKMTPADLIRIYHDPAVVTRAALPPSTLSGKAAAGKFGAKPE